VQPEIAPRPARRGFLLPGAGSVEAFRVPPATGIRKEAGKEVETHWIVVLVSHLATLLTG
jgi:hypothetical protein